MGYQFDDTGINFYYFLLSILVLYISLSTFYYLRPYFGSQKLPKHAPNSSLCIAKTARLKLKKRGSLLSVKNIFYVFAIILSVVLAFLISTHKGEEAKLWDPYEVLGLQTGADVDQINKAYRTLARTWHPDKNKDRFELAQQKFIEIAKAYATLTNEDARNNWELYGNPDGRQTFSLGIGLPSWIVEKGNAWIVLGAYISGFGLFLPIVVGRWWSKSKRYTKDRILQDTMQMYFMEITETLTIKKLIDIVCASNEFVEDLKVQAAEKESLKKLEQKVQDALMARGDTYKRPDKPSSAGFVKAHVLLYSHLLRISIEDLELSKDKDFVVENSAHLVLGALQISTARDWPTATQACMELSQLIIQAVWINDPQIACLPHLNYDIVKKIKSSKPSLRYASQLLALDEVDRNALLSGLSSEQILDVISVANNIPRLEIVSARFNVPGEKSVVASSLVSFEAKFKLVYGANATSPTLEGNFDAQIGGGDKPDEPTKKNIENDLSSIAPASCPYFPLEKWPQWWVLLGEPRKGKLACPPVKVTQSSTEPEFVIANFQFQTPPRPGVYPMAVWARCDSFVGLDTKHEIKMVITEPPKVEEPVVDADEEAELGLGDALHDEPEDSEGEDGSHHGHSHADGSHHGHSHGKTKKH